MNVIPDPHGAKSVSSPSTGQVFSLTSQKPQDLSQDSIAQAGELMVFHPSYSRHDEAVVEARRDFLKRFRSRDVHPSHIREKGILVLTLLKVRHP